MSRDHAQATSHKSHTGLLPLHPAHGDGHEGAVEGLPPRSPRGVLAPAPLTPSPGVLPGRGRGGEAEGESGGGPETLGPPRLPDDEDEAQEVEREDGSHIPHDVSLGVGVQPGHLLVDELLLRHGAGVALALAP